MLIACVSRFLQNYFSVTQGRHFWATRQDRILYRGNSLRDSLPHILAGYDAMLSFVVIKMRDSIFHKKNNFLLTSGPRQIKVIFGGHVVLVTMNYRSPEDARDTAFLFARHLFLLVNFQSSGSAWLTSCFMISFEAHYCDLVAVRSYRRGTQLFLCSDATPNTKITTHGEPSICWHFIALITHYNTQRFFCKWTIEQALLTVMKHRKL